MTTPHEMEIPLSEGERMKIRVKCSGADDWSRALYRNVDTGAVYVLVDGILHTMTEDWGEPIAPLGPNVTVEVLQ